MTIQTQVQVSTHQVPCGQYSIFDIETASDITEFERAVYLVINEHSDWDKGESHGLSYQRLADLLNIKHRSQVVRAVQSLIAKGWLSIDRQRKKDGANIYRITHHKCPPEHMPRDKDGRPKKCAIPRDTGSPTRLVAEGKLDWRAMVQWIVNKINSNWITGIVEMTVRKANELLSFGMHTIIDNTRRLIEVGLLERLSAKNEPGEFQLYPMPYPDRKKRAEPKYDRPMPLIKGWFYSFNKRWRFNRDTFEVQKEDVGGEWRYSTMDELRNINKAIYKDFQHLQTARILQ